MSSAEQSDDVECPTCGRTDFASKRGVRLHHTQVHGERIKREYECHECSATFTSERKLRCEHNFCSDVCLNNWQSTQSSGENNPSWNGGKEQVTCNQCGDTYEVKPSEEERSSFCSKECQGEWMSENNVQENHPRWDGGLEEQECERCGNIYFEQSYRTERTRFCSSECMYSWKSEELVGEDCPSWKGGDVRYYGSNWSEISDEIRARDNNTCQRCAESDENEKLDVHHIVPIRHFRNHSKDFESVSIEDANVYRNLITLCHSCNMKVDLGDIDSPVPDSHWRAE